MRLFLITLGFMILIPSAMSQDVTRPQLIAGRSDGHIRIDGDISEPCWLMADSISNFLTIDPVEGREPTEPTVVRGLADKKNLYFSITCYEKDTKAIVAYSKARDSIEILFLSTVALLALTPGRKCLLNGEPK